MSSPFRREGFSLRELGALEKSKGAQERRRARQQASQIRKAMGRKARTFQKLLAVLALEAKARQINPVQYRLAVLGVCRRFSNETGGNLLNEHEINAHWAELKKTHPGPEGFRRLNNQVEAVRIQLGSAEPVQGFESIWNKLKI